MAFNRDIIFIDNETKLNAENMNNFMEGINESFDNSETAIKNVAELETATKEIKNILGYDSIDNYTLAFDESGKILWVNSDVTLSEGAFYTNCPTATKVVLSKNLTDIGGAFSNHENVVDVYMYPDNEDTLISAFASGSTGVREDGENVYIRKLNRNYLSLTDLQTAVGFSNFDGNIGFEKFDSEMQKILNGLITPPLPWAGLKVSVLGDSTSAYKGYIPSGNAAYYTGSNSGVSSYEEMWWNVFCEKLGAERCVINAWSGSAICSGVTSATPCSDTSRCQNLHTDEAEPDVILISAGNNDCGNSVSLGDWDGSTKLDTTDTSTFRSAYANMLARIHERYPKALVICLSPTFTMRLTAEKYDTGRNSLDLTYADYENAVKEIANLMQCVYVDQNNFGFTRYNYYGNFCVDSSTKPMHPNALGHQIIGKTLANICENVAKGYIEWIKTNPTIYIPEDETEILTYNLTGADFVQGSIAGQSTGNLPPASSGYIKSNTLICSKVDLNMPIVGGTTVIVEVTAVDTSVELEVALQAINQDAVEGFGTSEIGFVKADAYGGGELPTAGAFSKTSGWLASGTEWTIPEAGVCLFVTVHRKDQTAITPAEIESVTITEVS